MLGKNRQQHGLVPPGHHPTVIRWAEDSFIKYSKEQSIPVQEKPPMAIKVGDAAPDFTLPNQAGESVSLSSFRSQKAVVLYFYPKDDTPGCTVESCSFRDRYEDFLAAGAEVIGISSDSPDSHRAFASKHNLPFTLVSDMGSVVRKAYGVPATLGLLPGRVTYVIDKAGTVRHVFNSQFNPQGHVTEALGMLKDLQAA
jgi:peroxiredoxin Q/BCP